MLEARILLHYRAQKLLWNGKLQNVERRKAQCSKSENIDKPAEWIFMTATVINRIVHQTQNIRIA